jgi:hypothetical protein
MTVSFALPSAAPASLELLDVMGRRWLQQEIASSPGSHQVEIRTTGHVPAGLYFLRLSQDGLTTSSRVASQGRGKTQAEPFPKTLRGECPSKALTP